jgi:hybrid cluster-associated redox disulfide protein
LCWRNDVLGPLPQVRQTRDQTRDQTGAGGPMLARDIETPNMPLQVLFHRWPAVLPVFLAWRIQCFGCPIAPFHTVTNACLEYDLDEAEFRRDLRAAIAAGQS